MRKATVFFTVCFLLAMAFSAHAETGIMDYTNPETGYRAVLMDEIDLIAEQNEEKLFGQMKELTEYGNFAFRTCMEAQSQQGTKQGAEALHKQLFGTRANGSVFVIDMRSRYAFFDTEGYVQQVIPKSRAEVLTNNVRSDLSAGRYYAAVSKVYDQVGSMMKGEKIAQPMHYLSNAVIAFSAGLLFALRTVVKKRQAIGVRASVPASKAGKALGILIDQAAFRAAGEAITVAVKRQSSGGGSDGGGSSCSSCGGGSSCSSCGGGTSF